MRTLQVKHISGPPTVKPPHSEPWYVTPCVLMLHKATQELGIANAPADPAIGRPGPQKPFPGICRWVYAGPRI